MKAFEEYRTKRIEEWNNQKKRRLELRCSKYIIHYHFIYISQVHHIDVQTKLFRYCVENAVHKLN